MTVALTLTPAQLIIIIESLNEANEAWDSSDDIRRRKIIDVLNTIIDSTKDQMEEEQC